MGQLLGLTDERELRTLAGVILGSKVVGTVVLVGRLVGFRDGLALGA